MSIICLVLVLATMVMSCSSKPAATTTPPAATTSKPAATTTAPAATTAPATSKPAATTAAAFKWPSTLSVMTAAAGGMPYVVCAAWAPVLEKATGTKVRVMGETSVVRRYEKAILEGGADIGVLSIGNEVQFYVGALGYQTQKIGEMQALWPTVDGVYFPMVRGDSDIKTIYDIKKKIDAGQKVSVIMNNVSPSCMAGTYGTLAFLGLKQSDVTIVPVGGYPQSVTAVTEGKGDVCFWITPAGSDIVAAEASPQGIRWLSLPPEDTAGWARFQQYSPNPPSKITLGSKGAIGMYGANGFWVNLVVPTMSEDLTYNLVKWWNENFNLYKDAHPNVLRMSVDNVRELINSSWTPFHPGAIKYLKEIGIWKAEDDAWNKTAIDIMKKIVDARNKALDEAKAKNIQVTADSKDYQALWDQYAKDLPPISSALRAAYKAK